MALVEFASVAVGIAAGDAMVKAAPLGSIYAGTVHPGKYLVLVSGDTASVEESLGVGVGIGGSDVLATVFLPDIHPAVTGAIAGSEPGAWLDGEALGIVEAPVVAAVVDAADAGVKAARVELSAIRLADGLGGKGYVLFSGSVADVEAAVAAAAERADGHGVAVTARIVSQLHDEMAANLRRELRFRGRVTMRPLERGG